MLCGTCRAIFRTGFQRCPADGAVLEPLVTDPFLDQVFAGRYVIESLVGEGAMGRVYRARHTRMSKRFAVKIMFGDLAADAHMRARFSAEAEAASRLDHPNVVSVVDFGETVTGLIYMVMEFVEGKSLARLIEEGPMDEARVRAMTRGICLGLQHAHDRGLVHRDLKADNVVVVNSEGIEVPKIIDFGIAMLADAASGPGRLTAVGVVIGTPAYMSPEQACGEKVDHRSDLFSLGLLCYEMMAGKKPFDGHPFEVARQNVAATPPSLAQRTPGLRVDPAFEDLIFQLMAKKREERPPSAQAVVDAIDTMATPEGALERNFVLSSQASLGDTALDFADERPARARPRMGLLFTGVAIAAVAAVALLFWPTSPVEEISAAPAGPTRGAAVVALDSKGDAPPSPPPEVATPGTEEAAPANEAESPIEIEEEEPQASDGSGRLRKVDRRRTSKGGKSRIKITEEEDEITLPPAATPPAATPPPDSKEIGASDITRRYREVSGLVAAYAQRKGKAGAKNYEERLFSIAYAEALRNAGLRPRVMADLDRLEADLRRSR